MKKVSLTYGLSLALVGAASTTLIFWTSFFESFIFPKFLVLLFFGSLLIGPLIYNLKENTSKSPYILLLSVFISIFAIDVLISEVLHTSLNGVQGRNMGFLSYLAMIIYSLFFFTIASKDVVNKLFIALQISLGGIAVYGLSQVLELDPFNWQLVYEGIIGNFGNPNFMSTASGLSGAFFLSLLLIQKSQSGLKIGYSFFVVTSLVSIYFSKSTQGWAVFLVALIPIVYLRFRYRSNLYARMFISFAAVFGSLVSLAIFNVGPLARLIYEQSLSFRADFWNIAWKMALDNPIFGVGIDRYQNYYREYKSLEQVQRVGAEDFSDSAHNLYLHLAATGGFPLALALLSVNLFVGYRFIVALRAKTAIQEPLAIAFGLWLGIQAQSLISIEYPSIALWGWILGGVGVGISYERKSAFSNQENLNRKLVSNGISLLALVLTLMVVVPAARAQGDLAKGFYAYVEKGDSEATTIKAQFLKSMEKKDSGNPTLPMLSANSLFQDGAFNEAAAAAKRAIEIDEHDYRSWWFLASSLEQMGKRVEAIPARLKTIELSPFNAQNLLELARNYQAKGDSNGIEDTLRKLAQLGKDTPEYLEASKLTIP